jgi:hypothetical protein
VRGLLFACVLVNLGLGCYGATHGFAWGTVAANFAAAVVCLAAAVTQ